MKLKLSYSILLLTFLSSIFVASANDVLKPLQSESVVIARMEQAKSANLHADLPKMGKVACSIRGNANDVKFIVYRVVPSKMTGSGLKKIAGETLEEVARDIPNEVGNTAFELKPDHYEVICEAPPAPGVMGTNRKQTKKVQVEADKTYTLSFDFHDKIVQAGKGFSAGNAQSQRENAGQGKYVGQVGILKPSTDAVVITIFRKDQGPRFGEKAAEWTGLGHFSINLEPGYYLAEFNKRDHPTSGPKVGNWFFIKPKQETLCEIVVLPKD